MGRRSMGSAEPRTPPRRADIEGTTPQTCSGPTGDLRDRLPGPSGIVLVDDDWVVLSRLREIIEQTYDRVVVGACRCAERAILPGKSHPTGGCSLGGSNH